LLPLIQKEPATTRQRLSADRCYAQMQVADVLIRRALTAMHHNIAFFIPLPPVGGVA